MAPPSNLSRHEENLVRRLNKSLYGLKQVPQQCFSSLRKPLRPLVMFNQKQIIHFSLNVKVSHLLHSLFMLTTF